MNKTLEPEATTEQKMTYLLMQAINDPINHNLTDALKAAASEALSMAYRAGWTEEDADSIAAATFRHCHNLVIEYAQLQEAKCPR